LRITVPLICLPCCCLPAPLLLLLLLPAVVKDVEQQFKYTQPVICPNATCGNK
jgi:hypothetical protein